MSHQAGLKQQLLPESQKALSQQMDSSSFFALQFFRILYICWLKCEGQSSWRTNGDLRRIFLYTELHLGFRKACGLWQEFYAVCSLHYIEPFQMAPEIPQSCACDVNRISLAGSARRGPVTPGTRCATG